MLGTLYVVATPIGNLADISQRALDVLSSVDLVLTEDTRVSSKLLNHYQIKTPLQSFHQHSGEIKINNLIDFIKNGKNLALISDAGTPGISDPGGKLIAALRKNLSLEVNIIPIPGACAAISALSVSGWPTDKFIFFGFLPHKKGRQSQLKFLLDQDYPVVIYESKHRLAKLLEELIKLSADKNLSLELIIGREITKKFEKFYFGSPAELLALLKTDNNMAKGEFVVLWRQKPISKND